MKRMDRVGLVALAQQHRVLVLFVSGPRGYGRRWRMIRSDWGDRWWCTWKSGGRVGLAKGQFSCFAPVENGYELATLVCKMFDYDGRSRQVRKVYAGDSGKLLWRRK